MIGAAVLAHLPSLFNGFVWDDISFVVGNPVLEDGGHALRLFGNPETWGTNVMNPYYRPLTMLSFMVDTLIWGARPAGFHATNLLLHAGVCALLLAASRRFVAPHAALAAAVLFAVHPAHAEPVAYISARAEMVCSIFLLTAFLAWQRYGETGARGMLVLSAAGYCAALLSKSTAGLLPAVFALHGLLSFPRRPRVRDLLPFAACALGYLVIRGLVLEMVLWPQQQPLPVRFMNAGTIMLRHALMALSPSLLRVFHDVPLKTVLDVAVIGSWIVIVLAAGVAAASARRAPRATVGFAWFLAGIFPVSGLVATIFPTFAADRYLYIPLLGAALAAGAGFERMGAVLPSGAGRSIAAGATVAALSVLAGITMNRDRFWSDPVEFWEKAASEAPGRAYVLNGLGFAYHRAGRESDAERTLRRSLEIKEANSSVHLTLAGIAMGRGDHHVAERHTVRALELDSLWAAAHSMFGWIKLQTGNPQAALQAAQRAFSLDPADPSTRKLLHELRRLDDLPVAD